MLMFVSRTTLVFGLVAFVTMMTGCKEPDCATDVSASAKLKVSKNPHQLTLSLEKMDFLKDSTIVWDDIELDIVLKGKRSASENISLSLNGFKFSRKDNRRHLEAFEFLKKKNNSSTKFKLHKMYLNGAESFGAFITRIKNNDGVLQIQINGKNLEVVEAKITFKGKSYAKCPQPSPTPGATPTPTPTPVPVAPETSLDSVTPSASTTASTNISFTFSSPTEGNTFWCSLDNGIAELCSSPQSYSNLTAGSHNFRVYAQSPQGLADKTPASYTWKVDNVAPSAVISNASSLATLTKSREVSFEFSSSKPNSVFNCSLDGAKAEVCTSPKSYTGLSEGVHLFTVNAVDALGNVGKTPASFRWTVDATAPVASFIDVSPGDAVSNSSNKSFTFNADESADFECSMDGAAFTPCASPVALNSLLEGNHLFEVRAMDAAGNQGLPVSYSWVIDQTPPGISLGAVTPTAGLTNAKNISVEFSSNETGKVYCSLDGEALAVCVSPFVVQNLSEGSHSLALVADDSAGNVSSPVEIVWEMDFTAPVLSFGDIQPSASSHLNATAVTLPVNVPAGATLYASLNGQAPSPTANPIQLSGLSEGVYLVSAFAVDEAGNSSAAISHQFEVDRTRPGVAIAAQNTANPTNSDRNVFALSSNEEGRFECNLDNAGFGACESETEISGLADGLHILQVRAIDPAGNVSGTEQYSWEIDTQAPGTTVTSSVSGDTATFSLSASEPTRNFICSLDGGSFTPCGENVVYSSLALGSHSFLAKAVDAAGNVDPVGASSQFVVIQPIHTTITSATPGENPNNQATMKLTFVADQAGATFVCSLDNGAFVACASPVTYTVNDGTHKFVVKAIDAYGNMDSIGASYIWANDTTAPVVGTVSFMTTTNTITVNWTTNEPATSQVWYGVGANINQATADDGTLKTSHSVKLVGLSSNTTYSIQVRGRDGVNNAYVGPTRTAKTSR